MTFDAVVASLETLGPILELDRRWRSGDATARAEIQEVLDRPRCAYDDATLALYRELRPEARALVGEKERKAFVPAGLRAPWLALEEQSVERLASGLALKALALPDDDDYRDVMISLAPSRVVADELGADAATLFDQSAAFAGPGVAETFRSFGRRETGLSAFGWRRVETPHGVRFHTL
jgi:hypothetical protein